MAFGGAEQIPSRGILILEARKDVAMASRVTIDGHVFILGPEKDIDAVKDDVRAAVQNGGDLVTFDVVGGTPVSILVSQGVPVLFENTGTAPDGHTSDPDDAQYFREYYGYDG